MRKVENSNYNVNKTDNSVDSVKVHLVSVINSWVATLVEIEDGYTVAHYSTYQTDNKKCSDRVVYCLRWIVLSHDSARCFRHGRMF